MNEKLSLIYLYLSVSVRCTVFFSFYRTVVTKPKITTHPAAVKVAAGKKVTFKVKATGIGLKYQWYYQKTGTTTWVKMGGKTKATLSFTAKASQNGWKYRCEVKNIAGTVNSKAAKLTVK